MELCVFWKENHSRIMEMFRVQCPTTMPPLTRQHIFITQRNAVVSRFRKRVILDSQKSNFLFGNFGLVVAAQKIILGFDIYRIRGILFFGLQRRTQTLLGFLDIKIWPEDCTTICRGIIINASISQLKASISYREIFSVDLFQKLLGGLVTFHPETLPLLFLETIPEPQVLMIYVWLANPNVFVKGIVPIRGLKFCRENFLLSQREQIFGYMKILAKILLFF